MSSKFGAFEQYEPLCRKKKPDLPDGWLPHTMEVLPRDRSSPSYKATHVELIGQLPKVLKSGPNKGKRTWRGATEKRTIIVSIEEYRAATEEEQPQ